MTESVGGPRDHLADERTQLALPGPSWSWADEPGSQISHLGTA